MNKIISGVSAAALFSVSALAGIAPASAAMPMGHSNFNQQDRYIGNFCDGNPRASQCNDWQMNHTHWSNNQYQSFYRFHRNDSGFGGSAVAGLFGLAIGALAVGALDNSSAHVRICQSTYRTYDLRSDTYFGFDGSRHFCRV